MNINDIVSYQGMKLKLLDINFTNDLVKLQEVGWVSVNEIKITKPNNTFIENVRPPDSPPSFESLFFTLFIISFFIEQLIKNLEN